MNNYFTPKSKRHQCSFLFGFIFFFLSVRTVSFAQDATPPKWKPILQFDSYYSFVGNKGADVWGFKVGVDYKDKWRFAVGFNQIKSDIVEYEKVPLSDRKYTTADTVKSQLYMNYYPVMVEYVFYDYKPWQISVPFNIGRGVSYFKFYDNNNNAHRIEKHGVLVSSLGLNIQYRVLKWFGLGAGVGYRFLIINNPKVDTNFNSPTFSIRLKLYPNEILHSIFPQSSYFKSYYKD